MAAELKLTGKEDVTEKLFKLERQNLRLIEQNKRLAQESKRATRSAKKGIREVKDETRGWGESLLKIGAGYVSVQTALRTVIAYEQDLKKIRAESRRQYEGLASSQAGAINMLGDVTPEQVKAFIARVDKTAAEVKPVGGKAAFYRILEGTLSAAGDQDLAFRAAKLGAQLGPKSEEEAQAIAGGVLDLAQLTGETKDLMKNAGFLIAATTQARVQSLQGMARYGTLAAGSIMSTGGTASEAMSLFTAVTKGMGDAEGRVAKTTSIGISDALAKFLPEKDVFEWKKDKRGRVQKERVGEGTGLASPRERLKALWDDPELRAQFDAEYISAMEKQAKGAARKLVAGPDTMVSQAFLTAMDAIPDVSRARPYADRKLAALEVPQAQKITAAVRTFDSTVERLVTETAMGRKAAIAGLYSDEALDNLLKMSGSGYARRTEEWVQQKWFAGDDPQPEFEDAVRSRIKELEHEVPWYGRTFGSDFPKTKDPDRLKTAQILRDALTGMRADLAQQLDVLKNIERQGRNPAPAAVQGNLQEQ